ncbi:sensor histidine kinase [Janibacter melonis]|uniref:sensor histidine kinase n=1 Tax=Janibacter melonis TaxID=262209 RepID=UPI002043C11B|nr:sensor histidine kinase [Janibacter melonis]MCM3555604.1 sensor histidine kinase [Janibacter melonis]
MRHSSLTPVFVGLRTGLHVLLAALLALVVVQVLARHDGTTWVALVLAALFALVYLLGARLAATTGTRRAAASALWVGALTLVWVALLWRVPEAAYLVFPLFFLYLHVLPGAAGPVAVVLTTGVAVVALGLHGGFTVGGVIGPLVGAGVALLIGLGYRALAREAVEREALLAELVATRDRLAATQREQGVLAERSRLAREIHDTVAQGLSSIQMLLHAAEAADGERPGIEHIRLARTTAAEGLADTRRFIRELAPPALDAGLGPALVRLGERWERDGVRVHVSVPPADLALSMDTQTALLRVAQGALANVAQHAGASEVRVALTDLGGGARLTIADDGVGFDPAAVREGGGASDSFGLRAIAERVEQLGGDLVVDSAPGDGTTLTVTLEAAP